MIRFNKRPSSENDHILHLEGLLKEFNPCAFYAQDLHCSYFHDKDLQHKMELTFSYHKKSAEKTCLDSILKMMKSVPSRIKHVALLRKQIALARVVLQCVFCLSSSNRCIF